MGIISWIVLGLIAGFIGSKIVNRQGQAFGSILRLELSALLLEDVRLICSEHREWTDLNITALCRDRGLDCDVWSTTP
jgi:hypothetical protein